MEGSFHPIKIQAPWREHLETEQLFTYLVLLSRSICVRRMKKTTWARRAVELQCSYNKDFSQSFDYSR
jgi:hypothetical protein